MIDLDNEYLDVRPDVDEQAWPYFGEDEVEAAVKVLRSGRVNYWTGGEVRAFERDFAAYLGAPHAIAMANGTVTLELALKVLGVGPGDEVVTTPRTFIASASSIVLQGATPVLADVDRDSGNITAETIEAVLTDRTKAITVVHLAGWPCDMEPILELARSRGLAVIEDCAQAHGARYRGRMVGTLGDAGSFSFCQDKIMTTAGEGGLLTLQDEARWKEAWAFKDHGKSYDAVYHRDHPPGFRWLHESFGTNWRMTEVQAAVGRVQLGKLERWVELRNRNADILRSHLEPLPALRVPRPPEDVRHAYYKFYMYVRPEALSAGWDRDRIMAELEDQGVRCLVGSCSEIYRERAFRDAGLGPSRRLPVAKELGETSLMLEVHPTLKPERVAEVGKRVAAVVRRATRRQSRAEGRAGEAHANRGRAEPRNS